MKENGDIVACKYTVNISDNVEDVNNIPVDMKHQNEARQKQGKKKTQNVTSDHMKECLTQSDVQTNMNTPETVKQSVFAI